MIVSNYVFIREVTLAKRQRKDFSPPAQLSFYHTLSLSRQARKEYEQKRKKKRNTKTNRLPNPSFYLLLKLHFIVMLCPFLNLIFNKL